MPYKRLLDKLVSAVDGARGALLFDASGELVFEAGLENDGQRLIGAYQGIALQRFKTAHERCEIGPIEHVHSRYQGGHVILRPLKDGYYLVLALAAGANVGQGLHRSGETQVLMNEAL